MDNSKDIELSETKYQSLNYVKVQFPSDGRLFTYKTLDNIQLLDLVVINTKLGLKIARVIEKLDKIPELNRQIKAIYGTINNNSYKTLQKDNIYV